MKIIFILSRVGSYLIDYILYSIMLYGLSKYKLTGYVISLIVFFLYRYITTAQFGATLGMKLLKLKLSHYSYKICLIREVYRFASAFLWIGYFIGLFDVYNRTLHDIMANTFVAFNDKAPEKKLPKKILLLAFNILLVLSITRWVVSFVLNDIGMIGLKRVYSSDMYYQSFEGDNLTSISQDELYMKTLGRKYTTVVEMKGKPALIKISNKGTYIDLYKLNLKDSIISEAYLYKISMPLQYICSGNFRGKLELCGLSPQNDLVLIDEYGKFLGKNRVELVSVVKLMCGDIDLDNSDEAVILGRGGEVEVYKFNEGLLKRIYKGRFGEDIIPQTFYISKGISVFGKGEDKVPLYSYIFSNNKFILKDKKYIKAKEISFASGFLNGVIVSHVNRNNMMFRVGDTQIMNVYKNQNNFKKVYNFGLRPTKGYDYMVRAVEGVYDIDGDGIKELIIKAVKKSDVMGHGYIVEIYKPQDNLLALNRIFTQINDVLK